ncbi:MAG: glycosyltransferase [Pirellulaceae bacterium]
MLRPSRQYANDLSVEAINVLSKEPFFNELQFRLIGDGALFEETVAPLRDFPNVKIERRFLTQNEIAALHKEYGIFLCPSRWDSQGVSRDEAMSSGLVPVTSSIAAIPEFADKDCAVLVPSESAEELAQGIIRLYNNPDRFEALSISAARRVREQSDNKLVIEREINVFARTRDTDIPETFA